MYKYKTIPKKRLKNLLRQNLTQKQISKILSVSENVIRQATIYHEIPKRKPLRVSSDPLEIEKTRRMAVFFHRGESFEQIGKRFGLTRQGVRYRLATIGTALYPQKHKNLDKVLLQSSYEKNLTIEKIAALFTTSVDTIRKALRYYRVPKRRPLNKGGSRVDFLRSLKVGEEKLLSIDSRYYGGLYSTAKRIGFKITVRSVTSNCLQVTRIK